MSRPDHLPDYEKPPLNEVVLGVQFSSPRRYQQIYAGEVWELFRQDFPKVKQQFPLQPSFETFGRPQRGGNVEHRFIPEIPHPRYWFISEDETELIQFQQDRLMHNWRKTAGKDNPYPHFESILPKFENELRTLEKYFEELSGQEINITQCELSYISHIFLTADGASADKWIRLINHSAAEFEDISFSFRKTLNDEAGNPYGRLVGDGRPAISIKDEDLLRLNLTVRGVPKEPNMPAVFDFIKHGRELIVNCFDDITTEFAHGKWGRK